MHRHFFGRAHNIFLDAAIMKWCMLFADDRAKHRLFNLVSDRAKFKQELLTHLQMSWDEFESYSKTLRAVRDKFIAHLDDEIKTPMPMLDAVVESASFALLYLYKHESKIADLTDVPPPAHIYYDRAYEDARYAYTGKPKTISVGGHRPEDDAS